MSMLRGLQKQKNSSSICIGCSFFAFRRKNGNVFLVHSRAFKKNGKTDQSLRRKAIGPVKW